MRSFSISMFLKLVFTIVWVFLGTTIAQNLITCLAVGAGHTPVYPTSVYPAGTNKFYAVFELGEDESFKKLYSEWIVVDVGDVAEAGTVIATADLALESLRRGRLNLSLPTGFPAGKYRLLVDMDGEFWNSSDISVAANSESLVSSPTELLSLKEGTVWTYELIQEGRNGSKLTNTLLGGVLDENGVARDIVTFNVEALDELGAHIVTRNGNTVQANEWWRLDETGFSIVQGEDRVPLVEPIYFLPFPLITPQTWSTAGGSETTIYGPVELSYGIESLMGYVTLTELAPQQVDGLDEPVTLSTQRHFIPGVGMTYQNIMIAIGTKLVSEQIFNLQSVSNKQSD